jgi:putative colanic acid biosynthesis acetyltransferase WcaF
MPVIKAVTGMPPFSRLWFQLQDWGFSFAGMDGVRYTLHPSSQTSRGASPWTLGRRARLLLWDCAWAALCRWTPKPANPWRLLILRAFGATIKGSPFVHPRARIQIPWNIELRDQACVGDRANLYSVDRILLAEGAVVAQEAYLCAATHAFEDPNLPLLSAPIEIQRGAFVGARAFVLPGLVVGAGAVVGACSVVTRNVAAGARVKGNPAA